MTDERTATIRRYLILKAVRAAHQEALHKRAYDQDDDTLHALRNLALGYAFKALKDATNATYQPSANTKRYKRQAITDLMPAWLLEALGGPRKISHHFRSAYNENRRRIGETTLFLPTSTLDYHTIHAISQWHGTILTDTERGTEHRPYQGPVQANALLHRLRTTGHIQLPDGAYTNTTLADHLRTEAWATKHTTGKQRGYTIDVVSLEAAMTRLEHQGGLRALANHGDPMHHYDPESLVDLLAHSWE